MANQYTRPDRLCIEGRSGKRSVHYLAPRSVSCAALTILRHQRAGSQPVSQPQNWCVVIKLTSSTVLP